MKKSNKIIFLLVVCIFLSGCGGRKINYNNDPNYIGKSIVFKSPMVYVKNMNQSQTDKETYKYNLQVFPENLTQNLPDNIFEKNKKEIIPINNKMMFVVKGTFKIIPWGLQRSFSSEYIKLVLEDKNGLVSTIGDYFVKKEGSILKNQHITTPSTRPNSAPSALH